MTTTAYDWTKSLSFGKQIVSGALARLGGGVVFGIMMGVMSMLPLVGTLIGQENSTF